MKRDKLKFSRLKVLALVLGVTFLALMTVCLINQFQFWHRLFWSAIEDIGFAVELDTPQYGEITVTNLANRTAQNVTVIIREDFSYAGEGCNSKKILIGNMEPLESYIISYRYWSLSRKHDIGKLHLWIKCGHGEAYERISWSYALL